MSHTNVIKIHAMSEERCPNFFIILDCLSSTLDQKIANWCKATTQSNRSSTNDILLPPNTGGQGRRLSYNDTIPKNQSESAVPRENKYKFLLNRQGKNALATLDVKEDGSIEERLGILLDISSAMKYIHKRNILHRDIKPENVGFDGKSASQVISYLFAYLISSNNAKPMELSKYLILVWPLSYNHSDPPTEPTNCMVA